MTAEYDVAIVGARVAGSITASLLGDAGARVLLVDAARFPSDTISTHFFRGAGLVGVLRRLGVLDAVLATGAPPLTRQYSYVDDTGVPAVEPPQDPGDVGFALSVRRVTLDEILLARARRTPGVTIRDGTPVHGLVRDAAGRVAGITVQLGAEPEVIHARLVIGADGRGSFVARAVAAPVERVEPATRAMYFRYVHDFVGVDGHRDGPEFSFVGDELVYAFPSDHRMTCIAISINLAAFGGFRSAPGEAFDHRVAAHVGLAERLAVARPASRTLGSGPKDAVIRRPYGPGWALVGDACLHQDPWTGLGMDNAATQAVFLAEAVMAWLRGDATEADVFEGYHRRRDEAAVPGFAFTASVGRDLRQATADAG